ncbi:hypothetical protein COU57_04505 [Candidatus Pacearchaeota archaeon CG10_big_fil_rev_8_21_14_0_10_32_14]|nr:MAG: hypothetical protein COU57_04505 [Candidatus Pacearchaeota archaeon CG10_big_fil_rev_8_21_14_0_10_32_14]
MLNKVKKSFKSLRTVFSDIKYILLAILIGFLFYFLNFFISTFGNISSFYKSQGFYGIILFSYTLFVNFKGSILLSSFVSMIVLSVLTGILFSLVLYKVNLRKKDSPKIGMLSFTGMFLGIFAPGCAACGLGLAAFFGLAASFATLPLKGLEISILAMTIMTFSILRFSYYLYDDVCSINFNNHKNESKSKIFFNSFSHIQTNERRLRNGTSK